VNSQTDQQLLRDYTDCRSEAAFSELVRRHIDFVYSAALRMVCDPHLAEDVTQGVFVAFAKNAAHLTNRPVLSGWLHRTAQNIAAQTVRTIERRRAREQEAVAMNELLANEPSADWEHIAPCLDEALGLLNESDRDALLLRYFERKSAREMAQTLGVSEDAAQKRVNRAVERLREFFAKRGVTVGASGLVVVITANAVQAAPVGLAATIATTAALAGTTLATNATATATKAIVMTTLQKTFVTVALTAAVGVGLYEARQASKLRTQVHTLQQEQAEQIQLLQRARDEAMAKQAQLQDENARLTRNSSELFRLRGEVTRLRNEVTSANLTSKNKPASQDLQPLTEQAATNVSPVVTYSATVHADVPWNQVLVTGGWKGTSGKRVMVFASPKREDDANQLTIKTHIAELPEELAQKLGLEQFYTDAKETTSAGVLTTQQYDAILKAAAQTAGVDILHAPVVTTLSGRQAQIQSTQDKETSSGEKYSVGPVLDFMPTISADGQSVDLGVVAKLISE
jgi:RNA polymerase sigma factor (sigma-70 family)